ncbi:MAG: 5-formyltetrahydrofolate cyclo-ligase [Gammaproteobacteria bacterium]|nr:MAG: 5-formyltetrahydrofolate cyclo-ligase [Gammaproteobacteria bacterium]RLA10499.1 MAG: 5-formyltetrahydrofolate cyclo-ligase [Gammaproteobacteria bacterium]RLA13488.1 MAG: 5-formyltetrahydrofolate cyclo-ligase [Gammaproteobacteria bacterium]
MVYAIANPQVSTQLIQRAQRKAVRQEIRLLRRSLVFAQQQTAAKLLDRHLAGCPAFQRARNIAIYWPTDGEIGIRPLALRCWSMGKTLFLPVLSPPPGIRMRFARYTEQTRLKSNRYGIPEPNSSAHQWVRASRLDLLVMPLVAMDLAGNRIGMGAGYYDKTLQNIATRALRPTLIGVGHQFQLVEKIVSQSWDIPLDWLATDQCLQAVTPVQSHG